ncbi:heme ABC exporter ATP-binding protein CcmA [Salinibius halmophilus]|uniref:heme ABC exporter ATP-binding protein CcmA n=1 Tax=Salinibius halmophilus TaxID=1853216 RepID=UPI000E65F155|nr:heme ABC exporter ATP-binding protein CcmA [Salinibius halmophilus]
MLLSADAIVAERDELELFKPLSFSLSGGEVVHLVGPNGSGKSTLLRGLLGLNQTLTGDITWHSDSRCYVGHSPGLNGAITVAESLRLLLLLDGMQTTDEQVEFALAQVGLHAWRYQLSGRLSAGQTRKVALSRLYCLDAPRIWLLDEPFTSLDKASTQKLSQRISDHARQGGAVLLTSHQNLEGMAHRTLELDV